MRLILTLKSLKDIDRNQFEKDWRLAFNSFLYELLKNSQIEFVKKLHNEFVSPFCFGNVKGNFRKSKDLIKQPEYLVKLPYKEEREWIKENRYQVIVSTSNSDVAMALTLGLADIFRSEKYIELKEAQFLLEGVSSLSIELKPNDLIVTDNIVVLKENIKDSKDKKKNLLNSNFILYKDSEKHPDKKHNCIVDKELFIKTLQSDIVRKANICGFDKEQTKDLFDYTELDFDYFKKPNPETGKIKETKQTIPIFKLKDNDKYYYATGNKIAFRIKENIPQDKLQMLNKVFDTGLGSHCSFGFGFLMKK